MREGRDHYGRGAPQRTRVVDRTVTDAADWSDGLRLEVAGRGVLGHAGVVLPRMLADRIGLTHGLGVIVARRGFQQLRDRGRLLADVVAAMIAGARRVCRTWKG